MSSARLKPGTDDRVHLGDSILADLRASSLPLEPRHFEFWTAYRSRRCAALNAEADAIRSGTGTLTGRDIDRLHDTYLSPWRMGEKPDAIAARMGAKLQELALSLESAIGSAQTQRTALIAETAELSINAALTLQDVLGGIDRLTQSTRECQVRYGLIEARMEAVGREIAALQQQLSVVRAECRTDPTTALPNRAAFNAALADALTLAAAERQPLSVVLCNLDYFAAFNENFSTHAGDEVLRSVGMLFKAQTRPSDMVARYGGDEYAAILPRMRAREAVACVERFRQVLMAHELIHHPNGAGRVTVSIGVADAIKGDTPDYLLRRARNGLTVAKREGRNRVVEMTPDGPTWEAERRT